jgi:hypothetical protein
MAQSRLPFSGRFDDWSIVQLEGAIWRQWLVTCLRREFIKIAVLTGQSSPASELRLLEQLERELAELIEQRGRFSASADLPAGLP